MKIGIYSPYLDTLTGGEKYIFTVASCLAKEHDVFILWDDPSIVEKASEKFGIDLGKLKITSNIFDKNGSIIRRFIQSMSFDRIFYLSDGSLPIVGCKLLIHLQFPVEWVNTNSFPFMFKRSRVHRIICNSYFTKKYVDRKFGGESSVLYPPAEISGVPYSYKEKIILTVGRYNKLANGSDFKKLYFMVESFKKFQKKRLKGWKMVIITSVREEESQEFEKFKKQVKSNFIKIFQSADRDTIMNFYKKSMIYWHAAGYGENLEKNPERAEHFGISTVEAMSHGAVPIVINAGGQKEIVKEGENGYLWDTQDELIEKTHKIAVDKKLSKRLKMQAIDSSKRFSGERFCEELNHLIW